MLKFLGTGSAFNTKLGNNSAYIKENSKLLLIDCGELTFDRILKMNLLDGVDTVHIVVTHAHPDHIGSLGSFIFYCFYVKKIRPTFHAANTDFIELLDIMGITKIHCQFENHAFNPSIELDDMDLELYFVENDHTDELVSFGFLLSGSDHKTVIYYSGDSCDIPKSVLEAFKEGKINFIYQDTCKADHNGNVHLSLRKLAELIPYDLRDRVYCIHLDSGFVPEEAEQLGFNVVKVDKN